MKAIYLLFFCATISYAQSFNQQQKIKAQYQFAGNNYGQSIDITNDLMIVGDTDDSYDAAGTLTASRSGSVHIYRKDGNGLWQFEQRFIHPSRLNEASYGHEVEIENDIAVVSAIFGIQDVNGVITGDAGAVFIYRYDDVVGTWSLLQEILAPTMQSTAYFGMDFSLNNGTLIIGEPWQSSDPNDTTAPLVSSGVVHIYEFDQTLNNFQLDHSITAPVRTSSSGFGWGLDFEGDKLVVGEARKTVNINGSNYNSHGEAHYFQRDQNGIFQHIQSIQNLEEKSTMEFGHTISLAGDVVAISAPFENLPIPTGTNFDQGEVYLYKYDATTNNYVFTQTVTSNNIDANWFGFDTDLENGKLVASSYQDRFPFPGSNFPAQAGAIWYFELDNMGFVNQTLFHSVLSDNATNYNGEFAYSVSISGDVVVAGAPDDEFDLNNTNILSESGAVFIYNLSSTASIIDTKENLSLYPNPASNFFKFKNDNLKQYRIYNMNGRLVQRGSIKNKSEVKTTLESGIYIVQLIGDSTIKTGQLIVKK